MKKRIETYYKKLKRREDNYRQKRVEKAINCIIQSAKNRIALSKITKCG